MKRFEEILIDQTKTATKIPQSDYLENGKYRIFDQGKEYSVGFSNDENGVVTDFPYIIFGDHTRVVKFVNEPCFIGADGVKLLKVVNKDFDSKYIYYNILAKPIENQGYARHFKFVKEIMFTVKSLPEQQKIAAHLDSIQSAIDNKKQQLAQLDELVKSKFVEMFGEVIENTKNLPLFLFGDICFLKAGDFTPAKDIKEVKSEEFPYPCFGGNGIRGYVDNFTKEGDFPLIGRQGALCGNVQFASGRFRNTEHAVLVKPLKDGINPLWLYKLLENLNLNRYQTGAAQPGLSVKTLELIKIPIADFELQNTFAEYVQKIDSAKSIIKTQLEDVQELLDSKMDEYFGE